MPHAIRIRSLAKTFGTGRRALQDIDLEIAPGEMVVIEGTSLTERQGWAFMQTLKLVRAANTSRNGRYNPDDYQDGAAYAALGAEAASKTTSTN